MLGKRRRRALWRVGKQREVACLECLLDDYLEIKGLGRFEIYCFNQLRSRNVILVQNNKVVSRLDRINLSMMRLEKENIVVWAGRTSFDDGAKLAIMFCRGVGWEETSVVALLSDDRSDLDIPCLAAATKLFVRLSDDGDLFEFEIGISTLGDTIAIKEHLGGKCAECLLVL